MTGQDFREWRESLGISKNEVAKRARTSRQNVLNFENRAKNLTLDLIYAYGFTMIPMVGSTVVKDLQKELKEIAEYKLGAKCDVEINIKLCGEDEE